MEEISVRAQLPVEEVRRVLDIGRHPVSLDRPVGEGDDCSFGEFIEDSSNDSPVRLATNGILRDRIEGLLKTLTYREREIIRLRYGLGDGYTYTLEEVGRIFKVTRERVRQIEAKAVRKLQNPVRSQCLEGFVPEFPLVDTREVDNKHHAEVTGEKPAEETLPMEPTAPVESMDLTDPLLPSEPLVQDLFSFENSEMDKLFAGVEMN